MLDDKVVEIILISSYETRITWLKPFSRQCAAEDKLVLKVNKDAERHHLQYLFYRNYNFITLTKISLLKSYSSIYSESVPFKLQLECMFEIYIIYY